MTTHVNQSIKLFKKYFPLTDRCRKLGKGEKVKNCLDWGSNLRPGIVEFEMELKLSQHSKLQYTFDTESKHTIGKNGEYPMIAYCFTQYSNGCSLGSLLFLRQDNHVQRSVWHELATCQTSYVWFLKKKKISLELMLIAFICTPIHFFVFGYKSQNYLHAFIILEELKSLKLLRLGRLYELCHEWDAL